MGGMMSMLEKIPGMGALQKAAQAQGGLPEKEMKKTVAIINSMTLQERRFPHIIRGSRK